MSCVGAAAREKARWSGGKVHYNSFWPKLVEAIGRPLVSKRDLHRCRLGLPLDARLGIIIRIFSEKHMNIQYVANIPWDSHRFARYSIDMGAYSV